MMGWRDTLVQRSNLITQQSHCLGALNNNTLMETVLTAKEVMKTLKISENTLIRLESEGLIVPDFRLGNRKRYYQSSLEKQLKKLPN